MATTRGTRRTAWFWIALAVSVYVIVSAAIAVATADACDGGLDGPKTWRVVPPAWECGLR